MNAKLEIVWTNGGTTNLSIAEFNCDREDSKVYVTMKERSCFMPDNVVCTETKDGRFVYEIELSDIKTIKAK